MSRALVVVLVAAALLVAGGAAWYFLADTAAPRAWEQAQAALERHDLEEAGEHLERYVAADPGSAEARYLLARTLRRAGCLDEARRHLAEARRLGWDDEAVRAEYNLADIQARAVREMPGRELETLVRVQGAKPDRPILEALYRGDLAQRNWDRAGLWLHLWLEHYPDDWAPRLWQAELLERFKKYDRARADYLRVLELRPEHPRALLGVGLCALANRGDYAEAEDYLGRYLQHRPRHPEATLALARCAYARGDAAAARDRIDAVLADHPEHPGASLLMGTIEAEAGHDAEAVRWLRLGEKADPQGASYQLAQVLHRLGRDDESAAAHRRFTELRDANRALEAAVRAAEREPTSAPLQYEAGRLSRLVGDEEIAATWFQQALKQDPGHRPSHAALAEYYARRSDPEAARRAAFHRQRAEAPSPGTDK